MTIIKIQDLQHPSSQVCRRVRVWARKHDFDWDDFKKNGIDVEVLRAKGDMLDMLDRVEKTALRRIERENANGN